MVKDLQPDRRQAFQIAVIERLGPGGILADHDGGLHLERLDQQILGCVADQLGELARGQIAVERVFVVLVILGDVLGDDVGGGARRDQYGLEPGRPGLQRQHDFADIARDHGIDLVLADCPLEGADRFGSGGMVVVIDDLDHPAIDAALGVDLFGGELAAGCSDEPATACASAMTPILIGSAACAADAPNAAEAASASGAHAASLTDADRFMIATMPPQVLLAELIAGSKRSFAGIMRHDGERYKSRAGDLRAGVHARVLRIGSVDHRAKESCQASWLSSTAFLNAIGAETFGIGSKLPAPAMRSVP